MPRVCQFGMLEGHVGPFDFHMSGVVIYVSDTEITEDGKSQRQIKLTDLQGHALSVKQCGIGAEFDVIHVHDKLSIYFVVLEPGIDNEKDGVIWLYEEASIRKEGHTPVYPTIKKEITFPASNSTKERLEVFSDAFYALFQ